MEEEGEGMMMQKEFDYFVTSKEMENIVTSKLDPYFFFHFK